MKRRYYTCDVFTETRFGGNPLAVFPRAEGLSDSQMQQIAREFNFSETAFVFPPEAGHTRRVRLFTPGREVPFAGHPNVGTAFVLASTGELGEIRTSHTVTFEEKAGLVSVSLREAGGKIASCELAAPQRPSLGESFSAELVASAVSLPRDEVLTETHPPLVVSVGLPFLIAEVRGRPALESIRVDWRGFEALRAEGAPRGVYLYARTSDGFDLRARMFAPLSGVPEDPATGSAACAVAGLLAHHRPDPGGSFRWRIAQGVEMGRPSSLLARAEKHDGAVGTTWVGGACVMVSEGDLQVGPA